MILSNQFECNLLIVVVVVILRLDYYAQSDMAKLDSTAAPATRRSRTAATASEHVVPRVARNGSRSRHRRRDLSGRSEHRRWCWGWCRGELRWRRGTELSRWCTKLSRRCSWLSSVLGRHARHASEDPVAASYPLIDCAHLRGGCCKLAHRCCCLCRQWRAGLGVRSSTSISGRWATGEQRRRALSTTRAGRHFWQGKAQAHAPIDARSLP